MHHDAGESPGGLLLLLRGSHIDVRFFACWLLQIHSGFKSTYGIEWPPFLGNMMRVFSVANLVRRVLFHLFLPTNSSPFPTLCLTI